MAGGKQNVHNFIWSTTANDWLPDTGCRSVAGGGGTNESLHKIHLVDIQTVTSVAANTILACDEVDVTPYQAITLFISHAPVATTAPTVGTEYRVQISSETSVESGWRTVATFRTLAAAAATFVTTAENPGQSVIEANPTPAYTTTDLIFFKNNADFETSEWARIYKIVSNVSVDLVDALTNTQESSNVYNKCSEFVAQLDLTAATRLRVLCHNNVGPTAANVAWEVKGVVGEYSLRD